MSAESGTQVLNRQGRTRIAPGRVVAWVAARPWVWVMALTAVGFLLRRYRLGAESLWFDEADIVSQARQPLPTLLHSFTLAGENGPLYTLVLHYWLALIYGVPGLQRLLQVVFGSGMEAPIRGLAAIFGTAAIPLMYALARRVGGVALGIVAAILLTLNPFHIWHSQDAKMYTMLVFTALASTLLYVEALRLNRWTLWAGYVVATWVMLTVHSMAGLILLAQLAATPLLARKQTAATSNNPKSKIQSPKSSRFPWIGWGWAMLLVLAPIFPIAWLRAAALVTNTVDVGWSNAAGLTDILSVVFVVFAVNRAGQPWEAIGAVAMGLLAAAGAWALWRGWRAWRVNRAHDGGGESPWLVPLVLALWVVPILAFWLVTLRVPIFQSRYLIIALPAYLIMAAVGLLLLRRVHIAAAAVAVALLGASTAVALAQVNYSSQPQKEDWRGAMVYVQDHLRLRDAIIVFPGYLVTAVQAYYKPGGPGQVPQVPIIANLPSLKTQGFGPRELDTALHQAVSHHERIWLVTSPVRQAQEDPKNTVQQWLQYNYHTFDTKVFNGVTVYGISLNGQPDDWFPPPDYPEVHTYTNGIQFMGYIYEIRADATEQRDASYFPLTLYWSTDHQLTDDYLFRVQIGKPGQPPVVDDTQGFLNSYGHTTEWHPGTTYIDYRDLRLPGGMQPGDYTVMLQVYPRSQPDKPVPTADGKTVMTLETPLRVVPFRP